MDIHGNDESILRAMRIIFLNESLQRWDRVASNSRKPSAKKIGLPYLNDNIEDILVHNGLRDFEFAKTYSCLFRIKASIRTCTRANASGSDRRPFNSRSFWMRSWWINDRLMRLKWDSLNYEQAPKRLRFDGENSVLDI
jgi:hypothetical protein